MQVIPKEEAGSVDKKQIQETNIYSEFTVLPALNFQYQQVVNKFIQNLNLSLSSLLCDKFDIVSETIPTDPKEIYGGSFSFLNRYSNFLTAVFSTST